MTDINEKKAAHDYGTAGIQVQGKDNNYSQLCKAQLCFFSEPQTRMQVAQNTGIYIQNICRYVDELLKENRIWLVRIGRCPVTHHNKVQYFTTNPEFVPKPDAVQIKLFQL